MRKIIKCKICGELREHCAFELCQKCYDKQYRETHREEKRIYFKRYHRDHHEEKSIYDKQYYENHREEIKQHYDSSPTSGGSKTNKTCASYLGCTVAERVLSYVFKDVERMPYNNPGYDFICGKGFRIDVKSTCRRKHETWSDQWGFGIRYNTIADYFLCIAFDNREDLNPEHIWLIPGSDINDKSNAVISESTLDKWSRYELNKLDNVISCCNILRGE